MSSFNSTAKSQSTTNAAPAVSNALAASTSGSSANDASGANGASSDESHERLIVPEAFKLPESRAHGWTLGNSNNLVDGSAKEPLWLTLAWIVLPMAFFLAVGATFF